MNKKELKNTWSQLLELLSSSSLFEVTENLKKATVEDIISIIAVGYKNFSQLTQTFTDEKVQQQLKAKEDAIQKAIEVIVQKNEDKLKIIEDENKRLNTKCETIERYASEQHNLIKMQVVNEIEDATIKKCKENNDIIISSMQGHIEVLQINLSSLQEEKNKLQSRFDELNDKLPHMNMIAMGNIGQELVEELTRQTFNYECDVVSISNESHCMDIHVQTPTGFNANLEVKAADPIQTVRDVNKFHRDLQDLIDKSEINASALLSLKAPIPNYKSGTMIIKHNSVGLKIPVLYLHVTSADVLKHGLSLLKEIQHLCHLEHTARGSEPMPIEVQKYNEEKVILKRLIPELFKENSDEEDQLTQQLDHIKRIKDISENRLAKLQITRQTKAKLQDSIPWLFDDPNAHNSKLEKAIAIWEKYKEITKKDPANLAAFGVDEPFIKNIGFARLKEAVRENRKREKESPAIKKIRTE